MPLLDQADADEETKFIVEGMRARRANSPERSPSPVRQKSPDARHRKKLAQGRRNRTDTEEPVEETPAKDQDLPKVDPLPTVSDAPPDFIALQRKAIVGLEIEIEDLRGKWKTSQNRSAADRAGVVEGLEALGDDEAAAMAALVRDSGGG